VLFWYIMVSFVCVVIIFWTTCTPDDFVKETLASVPARRSSHKCSLMTDYTRCHWNVQVITPAGFNVLADIILLLYPFPIIFMANILPPLRYSLLFLFALYGLVTASAIIRVVLMTAGKFLQSENDFYT